MEETLNMTTKERERFKVLSQVGKGGLSQIVAGKRLGITDRQVRNLLKSLRKQGDKGIISKKRGKPSNHCLGEELEKKVIHLVRNNYVDFGPKLANEYLRKHEIKISTETLRQWMIKHHLWIPKMKKQRMHPPRERRKFFGELIQVDGSHHDWFEGRRERCVLMVFIDDATSAITSLYFAESETLEAYSKALETHLKNYGIPVAIYGDRCAVLNSRKATDATQFKKMLDELKCKLILAHSPQAKGKVERANRTLQDRLIKEMRLRNISTIEEANSFVEEFRQEYNKLFSKKPVEQNNAHRPLEGISLEHVICIRETRTLSKDFVVQFQNTFYQISAQDGNVRLYKGGKVEIRRLFNGKTEAFFEGKRVRMQALNEIESLVLDAKGINEWHPRTWTSPPVTHPYKRAYYNEKTKEEMLRDVI